MKFNNITWGISIATLVLYGLFILTKDGVGGLLASAAVGLIAAAYFDDLEYITATVVIVGLGLCILYRYFRPREGFASGSAGAPAKESPEARGLAFWQAHAGHGQAEGSGLGISQRVSAMERGTYPSAHANEPGGMGGPEGVYPVALEGFADVANEQKAEAGEVAVEEGKANVSVPAPNTRTTTATLTDTEGKKVSEAFQQQGLFKIGQMPSESADGPFVDVAATMKNALGALSPEQMQAMTAESAQMVETQKNLMNMLQSMRPVLQDARHLFDSFTGIFGSGVLGGAGAKILGGSPTGKGVQAGDFRPSSAGALTAAGKGV